MTHRTPILRSFLPLLLGTAALAPLHAEPVNRGMEPVNQPVVQRTDYVLDVRPDGGGGLAPAERRRILDWFDTLELGYGDRVSIVAPAYGTAKASETIANLVGAYGLLLADEAPVTAGSAADGGLRIVLSRSTATVPGCPDWKGQMEFDIQGGLSYNYGCATNGNLAAMIANPEDLIHGRSTRSKMSGSTSSRAIKAYRDATPSGAGGLK